MNIEHLNIQDFVIDKKMLFDVQKNIDYNQGVLKFYKKLLFNSRYVASPAYREKAKSYDKYDPTSIQWYKTEKVLTMENKISNMMACNNLFLLDVYELQKVKTLKKTNLCKDRFCNNCKKVKQALRMNRFIPRINEMVHLDKYHMVLSLNNIHEKKGESVKGDELRKTVDIMASAFKRLNQYLRLEKKISGIDFEKFGYAGALRSLEVTYNEKGFHPHYHVMLGLENYVSGSKVLENDYSVKNGKIDRLFNDDEILIQKLWRLLIRQEKCRYDWLRKIENAKTDNKKEKLKEEMKSELRKLSITKKKIEKLEIGFSVMMDKFSENDYYELFKYMTKAKTVDDSTFSYNNFLHLYFELKGVRQIQGYGEFFRFSDDDIKEQIDIDFLVYEKTKLQAVEMPVERAEFTKDLMLDSEYTHISKSRMYKFYRDIEDWEQKKELEEQAQKKVVEK